MSLKYSTAIREENCRLRDENEKLTKQVRSYGALVKSMEETKSILLRNIHNQAEATATLESEREANKQLTEELNEQARLLGISAEKELALLAKVEQLEKERDRLLKVDILPRLKAGDSNGGNHATHD